jgi:hypothetical protein
MKRHLDDGDALAIAIREPTALETLGRVLAPVEGATEVLLFRPAFEYVGAVRVRFHEAVVNLPSLTEERGAAFVLADESADHALIVDACGSEDCGVPETHVVAWPESWAAPIRRYVRSLPASMSGPLQGPPHLNRTVTFSNGEQPPG